jgi:hypothetical protein
MSLTFSASTDVVNCGIGATINNVYTGSSLYWVYLTSAAADFRFMQKGCGADVSVNWWAFYLTGTFLECNHARTTGTTQQAQSSVANFANWAINKWMCVAFTWSDSTITDNKLFVGDLANPLAEPSSYSVQRLGTGSARADAAYDLTLGNKKNSSAPLPGRMAVALMWNRVLTQGELQQAAFCRRVGGGGLILNVEMGFSGLTTQVDWSGNANNGTLTGCAVSDHVPLGPIRLSAPAVHYYVVATPPVGGAITPHAMNYARQRSV